MWKLKTQLSCLFARRDGTAGVEFAIMAPILLGFLVIMTDIGLAFTAQMNLDQAVKSGAEFVFGDVSNVDTLETLMTAAATGASASAPTNVNSSNRPTFEAGKFCRCPGSNAAVSCDQVCTSDNSPPRIFYNITGVQTFDAMALPDFSLQSTIRVQVR